MGGGTGGARNFTGGAADPLPPLEPPLFGCSALDILVSSGPMIGRPYGGMMTLLKNELMHISECIYTTERFVVGDLLQCYCYVYLPCVGTEDRSFICNDVLIKICAWRQKYPLCGCLIGGDFNSLPYTFVNKSKNYFSNIDYTVYNNVLVNNFSVVDLDIIFSDHLPICASCVIKF